MATPKSGLILLALTYFLYFGQLGVLVPYLGVFLDGRGFTSEQIGELFAIITFARIFGPNIWATLADKTGKGLSILQFGCFLTVTCFSLIFVFQGFWGITLAFALMMMFWTAVLPQLEVITLNAVNSDSARYSRIRLWGSIGFIVLTVIAGKSIDVFSSEAPVYASMMVLTGLFLSTLMLKAPVTVATEHQESGSIWHKVFKRAFICFILSAILLQVSFGPYYGFFALYMRDLGFSGQLTGGLVALGVGAEIFIFLVAGRLISLFGVKWILVISLLLTALRWCCLAFFAQYTPVLIFSQLLHAFGFGMTHAASMHFIHRYFGSKYQSRGQALYVSIAFGVGGALGSYFAGQFWQQGTGATLTFTFAAISALVGAAMLLFVSSRIMTAQHHTPRPEAKAAT